MQPQDPPPTPSSSQFTSPLTTARPPKTGPLLLPGVASTTSSSSCVELTHAPPFPPTRPTSAHLSRLPPPAIGLSQQIEASSPRSDGLHGDVQVYESSPKVAAQGEQLDVRRLWAIFSPAGDNPWAERLQKWSDVNHFKDAFVWVDSRGDVAERLTYGALAEQVWTICVFLRDKLGLSVGDRVALCYPPSLHFLPAFFACLCSGVVAIPVYPPNPARAKFDCGRFLDICESAAVAHVLTNTLYNRVALFLPTLARDSRWKRLSWWDTTRLRAQQQEEKTFPRLSPESVAFLQYTSGSTGAPKGVMVSSGGLLHNCHLCIASFGFPSKLDDPLGEDDSLDRVPVEGYELWFAQKRQPVHMKRTGHPIRVFSWLPVYHDMGLIGFVLVPFLFGGGAYHLSPLDFIKKPHLWLECLSRHGCVCTAGPNFAFELCVRKMPEEVYAALDLSHVCGLLCGAEPIRRRTVTRFLNKFGPKGLRSWAFRPAYGLAENTLIVSGPARYDAPLTVLKIDAEALRRGSRVEQVGYERFPERVTAEADAICSSGEEEAGVKRKGAGRVVTLVSCGRPKPGVEICIADADTRREAPAGRVGEMWVRSPSLAKGYFGCSEEVRRAFGNTLLRRTGDALRPEAGFLRTGDAGFFHAQDLYVVGRVQDLIATGDRRFFPQDIEREVDALPAVRDGCSVAFAVDLDGDECLGLAVEIRLAAAKQGLGARLTGLLTGEKFERSALDQLDQAAREQLETALGLAPVALWICRPKTLPKTSSGKLRRGIAREMLLSGALNFGVLLGPAPELLAQLGPPGRARRLHTARPRSVWQPPESGLHLEESVMESLFPHRPADETELEEAARVPPEEDLSRGTTLAAAAEDFSRAATLAEQVRVCLARTPQTQSAQCRRSFVVGASFRFPDECQSWDSLWRLLLDGHDFVREVPLERWNNDAVAVSDHRVRGQLYTRHGAFLGARALGFPSDFSATDRDQLRLRLAHHLSLDALASAGWSREAVSDSAVAIFLANTDPAAPPTLANRLACALGTRGPALLINAGAASGLVALDLGLKSLASCGEALVGGVNLPLDVAQTARLCRTRVLARDGRCKPFDARADGYVRGEGGAFLLVSAQERGATPLAVVYGVGLSHAGRAAPSMELPLAIAMAAARRAVTVGQDAAAVEYVECHGSGVEAEDVQELAALRAAYGDRGLQSPLVLGASKSYLGHLEGAAGLASLVKAIAVLIRGTVPAILHFRQLNPALDVDRFPVVFPTQPYRLASQKGPHFAAVTAFESAGTAAHVLLQQYDRTTPWHEAHADLWHQRGADLGRLDQCLGELDHKLSSESTADQDQPPHRPPIPGCIRPLWTDGALAFQRHHFFLGSEALRLLKPTKAALPTLALANILTILAAACQPDGGPSAKSPPPWPCFQQLRLLRPVFLLESLSRDANPPTIRITTDVSWVSRRIAVRTAYENDSLVETICEGVMCAPPERSRPPPSACRTNSPATKLEQFEGESFSFDCVQEHEDMEEGVWRVTAELKRRLAPQEDTLPNTISAATRQLVASYPDFLDALLRLSRIALGADSATPDLYPLTLEGFTVEECLNDCHPPTLEATRRANGVVSGEVAAGLTRIRIESIRWGPNEKPAAHLVPFSEPVVGHEEDKENLTEILESGAQAGEVQKHRAAAPPGKGRYFLCAPIQQGRGLVLYGVSRQVSFWDPDPASVTVRVHCFSCQCAARESRVSSWTVEAALGTDAIYFAGVVVHAGRAALRHTRIGERVTGRLPGPTPVLQDTLKVHQKDLLDKFLAGVGFEAAAVDAVLAGRQALGPPPVERKAFRLVELTDGPRLARSADLTAGSELPVVFRCPSLPADRAWADCLREDPDATVLVVAHVSPFALRVARLLIGDGCRSIVLLSPTTSAAHEEFTPKQAALSDDWDALMAKQSNVRFSCLQCDFHDPAAVDTAFEDLCHCQQLNFVGILFAPESLPSDCTAADPVADKLQIFLALSDMCEKFPSETGLQFFAVSLDLTYPTPARTALEKAVRERRARGHVCQVLRLPHLSPLLSFPPPDGAPLPHLDEVLGFVASGLCKPWEDVTSTPPTPHKNRLDVDPPTKLVESLVDRSRDRGRMNFVEDLDISGIPLAELGLDSHPLARKASGALAP